jgi:hypothetical protein
LADAKQQSAASSAPSFGAKNNATDNSSKILQIKISNKKELEDVKRLLDNFRKNGNHFIELLLPENKKILLPQKYFLTSYDILDIRNVVGVRNTVEITKR